jgi:hypothetical protein
MNIKIIALIFGTIFLASCAKSNGNAAEKGTPYAKSDLSSLQSCQFHADCTSPNTECVELNSTQDRRCYPTSGAGNYIGCTKGSLILVSGDPERFDCF